jgi:hypothetical protein
MHISDVKDTIPDRRLTSNRARQQALEYKLLSKKRTKSPPEQEKIFKTRQSLPKTAVTSDLASDLRNSKNEIIRLTAIIKEEKEKEKNRLNIESVTKTRDKKKVDEIKRLKGSNKNLVDELEVLRKNYDKLDKAKEEFYQVRCKFLSLQNLFHFYSDSQKSVDEKIKIERKLATTDSKLKDANDSIKGLEREVRSLRAESQARVSQPSQQGRPPYHPNKSAQAMSGESSQLPVNPSPNQATSSGQASMNPFLTPSNSPGLAGIVGQSPSQQAALQASMMSGQLPLQTDHMQQSLFANQQPLYMGQQRLFMGQQGPIGMMHAPQLCFPQQLPTGYTQFGSFM